MPKGKPLQPLGRPRAKRLVNVYIVLVYGLLGYMRHSIFGPFDRPKRPKYDPVDFEGEGREPVPTDARPGTRAKVEEMCQRYRLRQSLFHQDDAKATADTLPDLPQKPSKQRRLVLEDKSKLRLRAG